MSPDGVFHHEIEDFNSALEANRAPEPVQASAEAQPFRCLGHDRGKYFFLPAGAGQVTTLSAKDVHSAPMLMSLAPLSWWEGAYPGGKESFLVKSAGNAMMRACEAAGIYDPDKVRGRGVWMDDGRAILHLGDRILADEQQHAPAAFNSGFLYEQGRPLEVSIAAPLDNKQAAGLLRLCCEVAWENPDRDGRLLAGWLVIASVCGAMNWRPHLWITSEAGGGKSWVMDNLVKPVLGAMATHFQSKTTEAGIRSTLRLDARPVVFDEAETQNDMDRARVQQVLDLSRAASSEDGADIVKGTKDGGSIRYRIRSCFAFASVNLGLNQAADESRTVVLNISPSKDDRERGEAFTRLKQVHAEVMVPEFSAALLARTMSLLPVIRANADILAAAIARGGVSRRTGDTLGVVLAGAFSLTSSKRMTAEEADKFLASRAWVGETARETQAEPEWQRALSRLMQADATVTIGSGRLERLTVSELIGACLSDDGTGPVGGREADLTLKRMGMRVHDGRLLVGNRSEAVAKVFERSPWASGWAATLSRAPGAKRGVAVRFTPLYHDRALSMPIETLSHREP
jgi:putative DNA primase/helicase